MGALIDPVQGAAMVLMWAALLAGVGSACYLIVSEPTKRPRHASPGREGVEDEYGHLLPVKEQQAEATVEITLGSTGLIGITSIGPITPRPYTIPRKCGLCDDGISPLSGEPCVWCSGSTFRPLRMAPVRLLET